jgi:hypothetical protein
MTPNTISIGCLRAERSVEARTRYRAVIAAFHRVESSDLLTGDTLRESAIETRLNQLVAADAYGSTREGVAILDCLAQFDGLLKFLRRNRSWVRSTVDDLAPQMKKPRMDIAA